MLSLRKLHIAQLLLASLIAVPLLTSCRDYDTDEIEEASAVNADKYIQMYFTVSSGNTITRAGEVPLGGENGDGREAGFERENMVSGVTLVFFQNSDGINATSSSMPALAATKVAAVKYYPVTNVSRETQGTTYIAKTDEAVYTTGERHVGATEFDFSGTYHVLVIANANLTSSITAGTTTLSDVRDMVYSASIYNGKGLGADATKFVMTSENDIALDFTAEGVKTVEQVGSTTKELYSFEGIRIERMAARIDFSTEYSYTESSEAKYAAVYKTKDKSNNDYAYPGYVYPVYKSTDTDGNPTSADRFVVTGIVPFNLSLTNTGCTEYLFKRTDDATSPYLADETTTNWVLDPGRASKNGTSHPTYFDYNLTTLEGTLSAADPKAAMVALGNYKTTESFHSSDAKYALTVSGSNTADNMIIAYPKENTLLAASPLYYYATGLAIEGYYYAGDDANKTPTRYVYVGYLRHQGESSASYPALEAGSLVKTLTGSSTVAMNFGVVRNNIYRVRINKINEKGEMELKIKVKKWDPYVHAYIYM